MGFTATAPSGTTTTTPSSEFTSGELAVVLSGGNSLREDLANDADDLRAKVEWIAESFPRLSKITANIVSTPKLQNYLNGSQHYPLPVGEVGENFVKSVRGVLDRESGSG